MQYETAIRREDKELFVYGDLWEDGVGYWETWSDTGTMFEVKHEPEFSIVELYDEQGAIVPLNTLTPVEVYNILDIFTQDYWDRVLS